jgi:hypothetical protein
MVWFREERQIACSFVLLRRCPVETGMLWALGGSVYIAAVFLTAFIVYNWALKHLDLRRDEHAMFVAVCAVFWFVTVPVAVLLLFRSLSPESLRR